MEITIRHCETRDALAIKNILEQPSCYAETLQLPYPSFEKSEKMLTDTSDDFYSLVAEIEGKVAGHIGLSVCPRPRRKHVGNIGIVVSECHRKSGVGSALLQAVIDLSEKWLAIKRIELEVYTDNKPAIALYKKYGFIVEGSAKAYAFRNGRYTDVYRMARVLV
ncbi:GNAT family N-acetyltransferase [Porticoccus sp. GXU_MW_L64]